ELLPVGQHGGLEPLAPHRYQGRRLLRALRPRDGSREAQGHSTGAAGIQRGQALLEHDLRLAVLPGCAAVDEGLRLPGGVQGRLQEGVAGQVMRTYILRRLLQIVPTVLGITLVVFVMMRSIPGDPVVALLGDAYTEENAIKVRHEYGLDKPIMVQYFIWLGKLVQGDWGASILSGRPVLKDVLVRLPVTLELIVLSMAVALAIAIPAAIIGALRQNTWADYTATSVAMVGVSVPEFFLGVLLLLVFSV